jgi:AraC family transcriptional activator of pobA
VLLLKIKERFWDTYNPIEEGSRSSQIVKSFKKLLEKHYLELARGVLETPFHVQNYASVLNLHPNYLSQVIKSKTGKSVAAWISEKSVATAKALLKNTVLSTKEIAYRLGYSEATHFSRFFKKQTGVTPAAYRKTGD